MSRPTTNSLHESGSYRLIESFTIDEMAQFLAREAGMQPKSDVPKQKKPARMILLTAVLALAGAAFGWVIGTALFTSSEDEVWLSAGWQMLIAFLCFFIIWLPLHESIHALVFKMLGAPKVGFGYSTKGMMVYAYAQRFVMTLRENSLVAAMPFVVITSLLILLIFLVPELKTAWIFTLLLHTLGCFGDFILIKHAWKNRHRDMYTYDDMTEKRTYFFEKTELKSVNS
ncbi:DUF3267 domain-containing protein [Arundinibacter roseus]|uniref:DUF3267 domain-containing protein n=1 Tax=Arundinibacter roseus TaxID=2070510 RepID=A0A4V2XA41_9BACT|nr:DUF3267 domain-containing protein [Arundinibacter roseus]TDB65875.1 DUF3267 domain-containing protein [Arundinibacter roseus]